MSVWTGRSPAPEFVTTMPATSELGVGIVKFVTRLKRSRLYRWLDDHGHKALAWTVALLGGADLASAVAGLSDPITELVGRKGFSALLVLIGIAAYVRARITGARGEAMRAQLDAIQASAPQASTPPSQ